MQTRPANTLPAAWPDAVKAVIPGVLASVGLVKTDFSIEMFVGLGLLMLYLIAAYWLNQRHLPMWSLMAAGFCVAICLTIMLGILAGLLALAVGKTLMEFSMPPILGLACIGLLVRAQRDRPVAPQAWRLLALIIVCQLAVRLKYFVLFGFSTAVAGQWLWLSFYAVLSSWLLPMAIGLCWIRRYGDWAMLYIIGTTYVGFALLTDINHVVSDQVGMNAQFVMYQTLVPLLFTVVAPLVFVRVSFARARIMGLVAGLVVVFDLIIVLIYGNYALLIWLSAIPYTLSLLLALALAFELFSTPIGAPAQHAIENAR